MPTAGPGEGRMALRSRLAYSDLMDAAHRQLSDQIDQATQRLLDVARVITEPDLRAPSLLPGWTRAHVLAHLARTADAMRNLLIGARTGQDRPAYVSAEAREAGIEAGAGLNAKDLMADLADSAMAFRTVARQLPDDAWGVPVRVLNSRPFPAGPLLTRRPGGGGPPRGRSPSRCGRSARTGSGTRRQSRHRNSAHPGRPRPSILVSGSRGAGSGHGDPQSRDRSPGGAVPSFLAAASSGTITSLTGGGDPVT